MWFKNLIVYRLPADFTISPDELETQLARRPLQACGGLDMESRGWVEPKDKGKLAHVVNQQMLIALGVEKKLLPASVINRFTKDRAAELEEQQGFKPGRKQLRELKEQITTELLPRAFASLRSTRAWIDPLNHWLVVDAGAQGKADELLEILIKTVDNLPAKPLQTETSASAAMTAWLANDEAPGGFSIDRDLELRSVSDEKATVRYAHHNLEPKEIGAQIASGKTATRLALTWNNRISLVLNENLQLKRINALDIIKESLEGEDADALFDIDFTLMTGEINRLLADLTAALGGEKAPK